MDATSLVHAMGWARPEQARPPSYVLWATTGVIGPLPSLGDVEQIMAVHAAYLASPEGRGRVIRGVAYIRYIRIRANQAEWWWR